MRARRKSIAFAAISFTIVVAEPLLAASWFVAMAQESDSVAPLVATRFIKSDREFSEGTTNCTKEKTQTSDCHWVENEKSVPIMLSGLYSRFVLNATDDTRRASDFDDAGKLPPYDDERCGWLKQFFAGRTKTYATRVTMALSDPEIEVITPLYSRTHECKTEVGNVFKTDFVVRRIESPLFRLSANSNLTVTFESEVSRDQESGSVVRAYDLVKSTVKALDEGSHFYSELTKSNIQKAAKATDDAMKGLFANAVIESITTSRFVDSWRRDLGLFVESRLSLDAMDDETDNPTVGSWKIYLSCPQPSVFSDVTICVDPPAEVSALRIGIKNSVTPGQVLGWRFKEKQTVADVVGANAQYVDLIEAGDKAKDEHYVKFCSGILNEFYRLGLNEFDAALVLQAAKDGMGPLVKHHGALEKNKHCKDSIQEAVGALR